MSSSKHAPWRQYAPDSAALLPPDLTARFDAGEAIELVGRNSGTGGGKARQLAVDDLFGAVARLKQHTGLDFEPLLPDKAVLAEHLRGGELVESVDPAGKTFTNRYAVLDLRSQGGVVVLLSAGSGHHLDADYRQPFAERLAAIYTEFRCCLTAVKRFDRSTREDWGAGPFMIRLRDTSGYLSDEDGFGPVDLARSLGSFLKGTSSRQVAKNMPEQTRKTQAARTGRRFEGGRVAYHLGAVPPPGAAAVWLERGGMRPTEKIMYLDSPQTCPDPSEVAYGLSEARAADGTLVDQVANVRYFLSRYGRPGVTIAALARQLHQRGFSTQRLRSDHALDAVIDPSPERAGSIINTMLGHLDSYESGVLTRKTGFQDETIEIEGFLPPDGQPWASPSDFARIRSYRANASELQQRARKLTFTGLRCTYDGQAAVMAFSLNAAAERKHGSHTYAFHHLEPYPAVRRRVDDNLCLPSHVWAASIVEGLAAAGDIPAPLADILGLAEAEDAELADLRSQLLTQKQLLNASRAQLDALGGRLQEMGENGQPVLRGALLDRFQDDYNALAEQTIPAYELEIDTLSRRVDDLLASQPDPVDARSLLELVESLRDTGNMRFSHVWHACLRNVSFTHERIAHCRAGGRRLSWTGQLVFSHDGTDHAVPFAGSFKVGRAFEVLENARIQVDEVIHLLRSGVPMSDIDLPDVEATVPLVRDRFSIPASNGLPLLRCPDPRLVRVATTVLLHPDASDDDLATMLDEPVDAVRQIRRVHTAETADERWLRRCGRTEVAMYVEASARQGRTTAAQIAERAGGTIGSAYKAASDICRASPIWTSNFHDGYQLAPCACGSYQRYPMRFREAVGPVCGRCHRDTGGVFWDADLYARWRAQPKLWDRD